MSARAAPSETAVVLLPTPPFWLAMAITRVDAVGSGACVFPWAAGFLELPDEEERGGAKEAGARSVTAGS